MSSTRFTRLIRFADPAGKVWYGEADGKDLTKEGLVGQSVPTFRGQYPWDKDFSLTQETKEIAEVSAFQTQ
jgi:hypothetical protein